MTHPHDDRRREPRLPPELALVAERLGRAAAILPPAHLRGTVLGAVIDALGTDELPEADLLPPSRREPWPAALVLLAGLALGLLVAPWLDAGSERIATPLPRFAERMAAVGIPLPTASARDDSEAPPVGDGAGPTLATGRFAATSIAVLRSLPPEHWLKGTL
ncbi:MAG: hypothetical protein ACKOEM_11880 [Planctomycetia bacterium]